MTTPDGRRKLIEVALPLDEINAACKADKDRKTGTIRNLHKWFAPMPLPAWRALLFAALVDDPADDEKRAYLLDVIKRLVANGAEPPEDEDVEEAQKIIKAQFPAGLPLVMDPFCGGGSTLVEAQRFGLQTVGSDLNPVPVLITRTLTQLLPKVFGEQPRCADPAAQSDSDHCDRAATQQMLDMSASRRYTRYDGLAVDVAHYARLVRDRVDDQVGKLYPARHGETPVAWIWARTAPCTNPACGVETVLTTSWWLSKRDTDMAWIEPGIDSDGQVVLAIKSGMSSGGPQSLPRQGAVPLSDALSAIKSLPTPKSRS